MKKYLLIPLFLILTACGGTTSISTTSNDMISTAETQSVLTTSKPVYTDYTDELYNSLKGDKAFVVFFHAPWCPICRQIERNLTGELNTFPEGTVILKADYDSETELKKKYGIRLQSTLIVIDANGEKLTTLIAPENDTLKAAIKDSMKS